jgi:DNA-binding GntR family transcriptional regulator
MQINQPQNLSRDTLRQQARSLIRQRLLEGYFPPGRLNESEIAAQIGISRTPLREALLGLEREGLLSSQPGQGFYLPPLSGREIEEIYPILWTLEALALRLSDVPEPSELDALVAINVALKTAATTPADALRLDNEWHARLLHRCGNGRLILEIGQLKQAAYRYEYAFMQEANRVTRSAVQHDEIIDALRSRDLDRATVRLEDNWRATLTLTGDWLANRSAERDA